MRMLFWIHLFLLTQEKVAKEGPLDTALRAYSGQTPLSDVSSEHAESREARTETRGG